MPKCHTVATKLPTLNMVGGCRYNPVLCISAGRDVLFVFDICHGIDGIVERQLPT